MKQSLVGVLVVVIILLCAVYVGISISNFSSQGLTSRVTDAIVEYKVQPITDVAELSGVVQSLNTQIQSLLAQDVAHEKTTQKQDERKSLVEKTSSEDIFFDTKSEPGEGKYEELKTLLVQRKYFLTKLAETDPYSFLTLSLPEETKKLIPTVLTSEVENQVALTGKIEVSHYDTFNADDGHFNYYLLVQGQRLDLYPTAGIPVLSQTSIKVNGLQLGNIVVAYGDNIQPTNPPSAPFGPRNPPPTPPSTGEHRMLVLLVNFLDSNTPPITTSDMSTRIFNGPFQNFYNEQSYGKINFVGDVLGWFTLQRNYNGVNPDWPSGTNELATLLTSNNINVNNYDHIVFVIDGMGGGFGTLGRFDINGIQYTVPMARVGISVPLLGPNPIPANTLPSFDRNLAHEIGHNLGVIHANALDCGNQTLREDCTHRESGNLFDTMGLGTYSYHFNAFYKELLGWVTPQEVLTITQNGRYTINPLESSTANSKKFAKILRSGSASYPYYVELRKAIGYDAKINAPNTTNSQNGLFINRIVPDSNAGWSSVLSPELLDMQPVPVLPVPDTAAVTLNGSNTFVDTANGITVGPIISSDSNSLTFDVTNGVVPCTHANPILTLPTIPPVLAGSSGAMQVYFGNGDSITCASSLFNILVSTPAQTFSTLDGDSGVTNTQPIDITVPATPLTTSNTITNLAKPVVATWPYVVTPSQDVSIVPTGSTVPTRAKNVTFSTPIGTRLGTYPIAITAVNKTTGLRTTRSANVSIVAAPIISDVSPNSGAPGSLITLSGTHFGSNPFVVFQSVDGYMNYSLTSNGSSVTFPVPQSIFTFSCSTGSQCSASTPPGTYTITLYQPGSSIYSNNVVFTVTP